ncbi:MAG TPA: F0F1 ATP synthase subunit B [Candidatus Saccharimonadales bacterium]|nr:F0F1 ATP synthase subunit B [Candidatus Saccharimonadales bacterium]
MIHLFFAAEAAQSSGIGALGISPSAFVIQLITFVLVFLLLKKFAFKPIVRLLEERRKVIDDGVKMGQRMEKERAKLDEEVTKVMRDARTEADKIIANGQKEAREIIREAEKVGQRKVDTMLADAEARINEETEQAKHKLEKEIVGMVSEATEAIVEEKVDPEKDAELIDKALKDRK